MFFILSKLLSFITTPLMWLLALLLIAIFSKDQARRKKVLILTLILFYLFCNSFLLDRCMKLWEVPAFNEKDIKEPYDAGIVLGGAITYDPKIERYQFQHQGDRIIQAILLYKQGKIKRILFSGGAGSLDEPELKEGPLIKGFLLKMGVPEADILIESESRNTRQNAQLTKALLGNNFPNGRFLLITSGLHQRRAVKCFEKIGIPVTPYSVDRFGGPVKFHWDHLLVPHAYTLFYWEFLTHEIAGFWTYKLMGYA